MIFGNLRNSMTRPTRVDHPRWSGEFFPLGNVRFRGVSKCLNNIFNISQVLVAGTESSRPLGVTKLMKMLKIDEKSWIFKIFDDFMKLSDPITAGGPHKMVRGFFPLGNVRFRGV